MAKHVREILWLLYFTETEATSVADTYLVYVLGRDQTVETEKKRISITHSTAASGLSGSMVLIL